MEFYTEFFDFLKNHETGFYRKPHAIGVIGFVCIDYNELPQFTKLIGDNLFDGGGFQVTLMNGYIAIDINDIIKGYGRSLVDFKDCFDSNDWAMWEKEIEPLNVKKENSRKRCLLSIDNHWENATLSEEDIQAIKSDIDGVLQKEYLITLDSGEFIEVGIIDDIEILG